MLKFKNQSEGEKRLLLFWRVARRLREVTEALPDAHEFDLKLNVKGFKSNGSLDEVLKTAESIDLLATFPTLPEHQFEVLALRFRPFFAEGERVNFLSLLASIDQLNEALRPWSQSIRERWQRAVFWGTLAMKAGALPVETDKIIALGFYSKYFHVEEAKLELAEQYRKAMGQHVFELALISAVWQRSKLVVEAAEDMEQTLIDQGVLDKEERNAPLVWVPDPLTIQVPGGPGAVTFGPPGFPQKKKGVKTTPA